MKTTLLVLSLGLIWGQSKDISGSCIGKMQSPLGEQEVAYRFKVLNGKITGSQLTNFGDQPITDGKFNGDEFEFVVERELFGNIQKITSKGRIEGDTIVITPGMPPPGAGGPGGGMRRAMGPVTLSRGNPAPSYRATAIDYKTLPKVELPAIKDLKHNGLAKTPPMGWNSWNKFRTKIDDKTIREIADAMASNGRKAAGYKYINIDDGWEWKRDEKGQIAPNPNFPDMKALADYVHAKGLKLGIYSSPGPTTCGGYLGSYGHEEQDAATWAHWGIDYLK